MNSTGKLLWSLTAISLALGLAVPRALAQDTTAILYGESILDTLTTAEGYSAYRFAGQAGDVILIRMTDASNTVFEPRLRLYGPDDSLLADEYGIGFEAGILDDTLPSTGEYVIVASEHGENDSGEYGLSLVCMNRYGVVPVLNYGDCIQDSLVVLGEMRAYRFDADGGDVALLRMSAFYDGDHYPRIELFGPDGARIATDSTENDWTEDSQAQILDRVLPDTGAYLMILSREFQSPYGDLTPYPFGVSLVCVNQPTGAALIAYGYSSLDTLGMGQMRTYQFDADSGDVVLLRMALGLTGYVSCPRIELFDRNGARLLADPYDECESSSPRVQHVVQATGRYLLIASEPWGGDGEFGMHLQCLNRPVGAELIDYGYLVHDSVAIPGQMKFYQLDGHDDVVRIAMGYPQETYHYPQLELFDAQGNLVSFAVSDQFIRIWAEGLPEAGPYLIVGSDSDNDTAGFWLSLHSLAQETSPIAYDTALVDSIVGYHDIDIFSFAGTAGDRVLLHMRPQESGFYARIELLDSAGMLIGEATRSSSTSWPQIDLLDSVLFESGTYTIVASEMQGDTSSPYWLSLQCREEIVARADTMSYGTGLTDSLVTLGDMDAFTFEGSAGDLVSIRAGSSRGYPVEMHLEVFGPADTLVAEELGYQVNTSLLDFPLPDSGWYVVYVSELQGDSCGAYWLSLQCRQNLLAQADTITYDTYLTDSVGSMGIMDAFLFDGSAGDLVTIRARARASIWSNYRIDVEVSGPGDNRIAHESSPLVDFEDLALPDSGTYAVYVARLVQEDEPKAYWLSLQCRQDAIAKADTLRSAEGYMTGELAHPGDLTAYVFLVDERDSTTISATEISGSYAPTLELFGPDDSLIVQHSGSSVATLADSFFTVTGNYVAFVSDVTGDLYGGYHLDWQGLLESRLKIVEAHGPDSLMNIGETALPWAVVTYLGWQPETYYGQFRVGSVFLDAVDAATFEPWEVDTLQFAEWVAQAPAAAYRTEFSTHRAGGSPVADAVNGRVSLRNPGGPEIHSVDPGQVLTGRLDTLRVHGGGFTTSSTAFLALSGEADILATSVAVDGDSLLTVEFDLASDVVIDRWDVHVADTLSGQSYVFYEGLDIIPFEGQILPYGDWAPFTVHDGSAIEVGVNVPDSSDLFIVAKKSTKVGYSGTWSGWMRVSRQGEEIAYRSGGTDWIVHLQNYDPGWYTVEIYSADPGEGEIIACASLPAVTIDEWYIGEILRPYGYDWVQVDVPADQDTLFIETEGFGLWSTIEVYYESPTDPSEVWLFSNMGAGYHIAEKIANPPAGRYYIRYMDSAVLYDNPDGQRRDYMLWVSAVSGPPPPALVPVIMGLSTYEGGQGPVTVTVSGWGFDSLATVSLVRDGYTPIEADTLRVLRGGGEIRARFVLDSADIGCWRLTVSNPSGPADTSTGSFEIAEETTVDIAAEIMGRDQIRVGRNSTYILRIENNGNIDLDLALCGLNLADGMSASSVRWNGDEIWTPVVDTSVWVNSTTNPLFFGIVSLSPGESRDLAAALSVAPEVPAERYLGLVPKMIQGWVGGMPSQCAISTACNLFRDKWKEFTPDDTSQFDEFREHIEAAVTEAIRDVVFDPEAVAGGIITNEIHDKAVKWLTDQGFYAASEFFSVGWNSMLLLPDFLEAVEGNWENSVGKMYSDMADACRSAAEVAERTVEPVSSSTPEDKYGPAGHDSTQTFPDSLAKFVKDTAPFTYRVDFWNHDTATAPAQIVLVKDTLNPNLDLSTFGFTQVGFLRWNLPLDGTQYFNVNVDMRPEKNLIVNIEGTLDPDHRVVEWVFTSLDPVTRQLPEFDGFLDPIDTTGYQIGWVDFAVDPILGLTDGVEITNQAWVNFDSLPIVNSQLVYNPAPKEKPWLNTIDAIPPTTTIFPLDSLTTALNFEMTWAGTDAASGIKSYSIYYSKNGEPYLPWLTDTNITSAIFPDGIADRCQHGDTYAFYCLGKDWVGHIEAPPDSFDTRTRISYDYRCGDITNDGSISVSDITFLIAHLFRGGPAPIIVEAADVDCSGALNIADLTYFIAFLFRGGEELCAPCIYPYLAKRTSPHKGVCVLKTEPVEAGGHKVIVTGDYETELGGFQQRYEYSEALITVDSVVAGAEHQAIDVYYIAEDGQLDYGMIDITGQHLLRQGKAVTAEMYFHLDEGVTLNDSLLSHSFTLAVDKNALPLQLKVDDSQLGQTLPRAYRLHQNYPNPFNAETVIKYDLPKPSKVTIRIYNILGQQVTRLLDEYQPAGYHEVTWNATNGSGKTVATGVYFYQIQAENFTDSKKMLLLK